MLIIIKDEILKLIEKFSINELYLMIIYDQNGVLKAIYHEFVLFFIVEIQIDLIQELMVYPLQKVNACKEQTCTQ